MLLDVFLSISVLRPTYACVCARSIRPYLAVSPLRTDETRAETISWMPESTEHRIASRHDTYLQPRAMGWLPLEQRAI